jgi:hypothetical protein
LRCRSYKPACYALMALHASGSFLVKILSSVNVRYQY